MNKKQGLQRTDFMQFVVLNRRQVFDALDMLTFNTIDIWGHCKDMQILTDDIYFQFEAFFNRISTVELKVRVLNIMITGFVNKFFLYGGDCVGYVNKRNGKVEETTWDNLLDEMKNASIRIFKFNKILTNVEKKNIIESAFVDCLCVSDSRNTAIEKDLPSFYHISDLLHLNSCQLLCKSCKTHTNCKRDVDSIKLIPSTSWKK